MTPTPSPTPAPGRRSRSVRGLLALAVAVAVLAGLAACGGDDSGSDAASATTAAAARDDLRGAEPEASPSLPVTVQDANGKDVTITDVSRIIPLNGDLAEVVFALGLGPNVVATDVSATYPAEAAAAPKIGYQRQLAAEGILSFSPTVVLGTTDAGPPPVIEQLRAAGLDVVILPPNRELEQVPDKVRSVAAALGVPGRGEELAASIEDEVAAAKDKAASVDGKPTGPSCCTCAGASTQMIFGKGAGTDQLLVRGGRDRRRRRGRHQRHRAHHPRGAGAAPARRHRRDDHRPAVGGRDRRAVGHPRHRPDAGRAEPPGARLRGPVPPGRRSPHRPDADAAGGRPPQRRLSAPLAETFRVERGSSVPPCSTQGSASGLPRSASKSAILRYRPRSTGEALT